MAGLPRLPRRRRRLPAAAANLLAAALLTAGLAACERDRAPELLGDWQAVYLLQDGDTVDVRLDDVALSFREDGSYLYTSTLDYVEEGTFRAADTLLYTRPRTADSTRERAVALRELTDSTLYLYMAQGDTMRLLQFERIDVGLRDPADVEVPGGDYEDDGEAAYESGADTLSQATLDSLDAAGAFD